METLDLNIERLGVNGEGIGLIDGMTLFVPFVLPGERATVKWLEKKKRFGRAESVGLLDKSPDRAVPACAHFTACGGCQLMHMKYPDQLSFKTRKVKDAIERIGKIKGAQVHDCLRAPNPLEYRNKTEIPFRPEGFGFFSALDADRIIPIKKCLIMPPRMRTLFEKVSGTLLEAGWPWLNRQTRKAALRHLIIRTSHTFDEALITLVVSGTELKDLKGTGRRIFDSDPAVKGVLLNINRDRSSKIEGPDYHLLRGRDYITEEIKGRRFRISAPSFFQINPAQAENLVDAVLDAAALSGNENVLDLYGGSGLFSLFLAGQSKSVLCVESNPFAVKDGEENIKKARIRNVKIVRQGVERALKKAEEVQTVVVDPPRKGLSPAVTRLLLNLRPKRIVYVSCDPATLARDLGLLKAKYRIHHVRPVDMFPQTAHVECVVGLVSR